jgi:hypothetical protein
MLGRRFPNARGWRALDSDGAKRTIPSTARTETCQQRGKLMRFRTKGPSHPKSKHDFSDASLGPRLQKLSLDPDALMMKLARNLTMPFGASFLGHLSLLGVDIVLWPFSASYGREGCLGNISRAPFAGTPSAVDKFTRSDNSCA